MADPMTDPVVYSRAWVALSVAHATVNERLSAALTTRCGVSVKDFELMLRLERAPHPGVRVSHLQETVRLTQSALSRMVARLVGRGWLSRSGDPADKRGVLVELTADGRDVLQRAIPVHTETLCGVLLNRFTPEERDQLGALLARVVAEDTQAGEPS